MNTVCDTSPITNLSAIGQLQLLKLLYRTIIIPQAVYEEMAGLDYLVPGAIEVQTLSWIQTRTVIDRHLVTELSVEIDPGESEAIALAVELKADRLIIDDYKGRVVASRFGLRLTGVLGILLVAKRAKLIEAVQPILDDLVNLAGFRVSEQLYTRVLQSAGE